MAMYDRDVKITGPMKTKITNDWLGEFAEYKKVRPCAIEKIVGCISLGFWYEVSYATRIKPSICIFNLSNSSDLMSGELHVNPKRNAVITWEKHEKGAYKEAAQELKDLFPMPLVGHLTLSQVLEGYKKYKGHWYSHRRFEDPALIVAWAGRPEIALKYLEWGYEHAKDMPVQFQENAWVPIYPSKEAWFENVKARILNPDQLRQNVEDQIIHHKLTKVPRQELIIDI